MELSSWRAWRNWTPSRATSGQPWSGAWKTTRRPGAQLAGAMFWYWHLRGPWSDGYAWLQRALAAASRGSKALRALLLSRAGHLAWALRDANRGVPYCEESIALYRELGDQEEMAFPLATLADLKFGQADRGARDSPVAGEPGSIPASRQQVGKPPCARATWIDLYLCRGAVRPSKRLFSKRV